MIKVNLLPVKRKKKAKPVPGFLILTILVTLLVAGGLVYFIITLNSSISDRKAEIRKNEQTIKELQTRIKEVEQYEKRNALFQQRKKTIEQLTRNKTVPVKVLDEISRLLPNGVWIKSMNVSGSSVALKCTAFTNTDVVNYVNILKSSKRFADVYLKQSVQSKQGGFSLYNFDITMKVKA